MFKVQTKDSTLDVSIDTVFENILRKAFVDIDKNQNIKNLDDYIEVLNKKLSSSHLNITHSQLYSIYFLAGYYYKLFLEKNNVKIIEKKEGK